jgi:hypothetical protein
MTEDVTNQQLLEAIRKYQSCPFVHELTCGNDSQNHESLKGIEVKGKVILICPDCDYVQNWIPDFVWLADDIEKAQEHLWK